MEYLAYTEEEILERVDEYALYSFYLGYQPLIGGKYNSPIRKGLNAVRDTTASFGLYEPRKKFGFHEFVWSDAGVGKSGNIFKFVQLLYGFETKTKAMFKIMADFGLGGTTCSIAPLEVPERKYLEPINIAVTSRAFTQRDLAFWQQFNIDKSLLDRYTVTSIKQYWIVDSQKAPDYPPNGMGFAYREWDKYQLYFPMSTSRDYRFRHNYTEACLHGWKQLEFNQPLCVITKSRKDVMCLRSFGYEAVSPRSENTLVPTAYMNELRKRYQRLLVLFDNDGKHKGDSYQEEKIYIPTNLRADDKDVSDYCQHHGPQETAEMLKSILC